MTRPIDFDDDLTLALAGSTLQDGVSPSPALRDKIMALVSAPPVPSGFAFHFASDRKWRPHAVPGIRMKVLAENAATGYATLVLEVAPGTRFPSHRHTGAEDCYVLSGSLYTCGQHLRAGDFVHADAGTEHAELWTEEGCTVMLVAPSAEHLS